MKINLVYGNRPALLQLCKAVPSILVIAIFTLGACHPAKRSTRPVVNKPSKPAKPTVPGKYEPVDTIRWTPNNTKPPISNEPNRTGDRPSGISDTYHIAYLLPFLTNQASGGVVPERSRFALQFYSGAKIALEQVSTEEKLNLMVDTWDTQASDADFRTLLNTNSRIQKPAVFIGPIRSSHLEIFSEWAKMRRKIVISPDAPNAGLAVQNPDFIQINPSLRAHCAAIMHFILKRNRVDAITLVCKRKEYGRLEYFQNANASRGATEPLAELVVPDATLNFDRFDLRKYMKPGRTAVFILPSWSSQDFVMAFLRRLKAQKGNNRVEVYGMPQWLDFEVIDAEYLKEMNVHVTTASYIDYTAEDIKAFQQKFYETTGTIPDEDAFNGYEVTLFTARMLARYGLSFPEYLERESFIGLHNPYSFSKIYSNGGLDAASNTPDYHENTHVQILKFGAYGYAPVE